MASTRAVARLSARYIAREPAPLPRALFVTGDWGDAVDATVWQVSRDNQRIRSGFFWLPSDEGNRLPGTLEIGDGGRVEVNVLGMARLFERQRNIPRIHGHVEKGGFVTLEECFFTSSTFDGGGIVKGRIVANTAFIGALFSEDEPV